MNGGAEKDTLGFWPTGSLARATTMFPTGTQSVDTFPVVLLEMAYIPQNAVEKSYYDMLWDIANNRPALSDPNAELSGRTAVEFFQRSGVDKGFLKQIWSLSTPTSSMNVLQFYVALRLITMIQNGEIPLSIGSVESPIKVWKV